MATLSARTLICNVASLFSGVWGAVTHQAEQAGCSRQAIYQQKDRVVQAVQEAQADGPSRAELLQENRQLRQENQDLWRWLATMVEFPVLTQQKFATAAAAMGLSLAQTVVLLTIVMGKTTCPSRSKVGRWVQDAAKRAGRLLQILDRSCTTLVLTLCLDEIFLRQQPVLMGVEPHSMAWVLGQRANDRTGETWAAALAPWQQMTYAVVDGGSGLKHGLDLTAEQRQQAKSTVALESNLDNFHIQQPGQKALRAEWLEAEAIWKKADRADRIVTEKAERQGQDARAEKTAARWAWQEAEKALVQAEQREAAYKRVVAALELFQADGSLNDRESARAEIAAALRDLPGERGAKFRRMAMNERALTFLDRLHRQLQEAEPCAELRAALVKLWQARHPWWRQKLGGNLERDPMQVAVRTLVCQKLESNWEASYVRVSAVFRDAVRASSVVECMNSVLRMHQARHRGLSQDMIDLKRLYWNCRSFAEGKREGHCPYEHLGVQLPSYDWWELLQMTPDELKQKLSSVNLAT